MPNKFNPFQSFKVQKLGEADLAIRSMEKVLQGHDNGLYVVSKIILDNKHLFKDSDEIKALEKGFEKIDEASNKDKEKEEKSKVDGNSK